ncbi:MAG: hypothetical protein JNL90_04145 [Planctomycetes bacterium]|nr:hypothetical protein [Planctomycetota bacterium]
MFDRFTDRARKVMGFAKDEAQRRQEEAIGTEHLLLGLLREGAGVGANALRLLGVDLTRLRDRVAEITAQRPAIAVRANFPFTPRAKRVLELAVEEAAGLGHRYVGTEHLLLGLILEHEGIAARALLMHGAEVDAVRRQIVDFLGERADREVPGGSAAADDDPARFAPQSAPRSEPQRASPAGPSAVSFPTMSPEHASRALVRMRAELARTEAQALQLRQRIEEIAREVNGASLEAAAAAAPQLGGAPPSLGCTERAVLALQRARLLAIRANRRELGSEPLLQALLMDDAALPVVALRELDIDVAALRWSLGVPAAEERLIDPGVPLPASDGVRAAAAAAERAARRHGRPAVGVAHLLIGLLDSEGDPAAARLAQWPVDLAALRHALERELAPNPRDEQLLGLRTDLDVLMHELRALRSAFSAVADEAQRVKARAAALLWHADLD